MAEKALARRCIQRPQVLGNATGSVIRCWVSSDTVAQNLKICPGQMKLNDSGKEIFVSVNESMKCRITDANQKGKDLLT